MVLNQRAADRVGIKSEPVRQVSTSGTGPQSPAVPVAALVYDSGGDIWVYTVTRPLTYVRQRVAVVEDGRESTVFVRVDGQSNRYVRVAVKVTRRTRDAIYVRSGEALKAGQPVVTAGALLLRDAMDALPAPRDN